MISEERLKQAVHEAAEALDRSLPDPEACTYEPSPEFKARMQTLIREMGEKRERKERRRKLAHRAACLAIAVVAWAATPRRGRACGAGSGIPLRAAKTIPSRARPSQAGTCPPTRWMCRRNTTMWPTSPSSPRSMRP